MTDHSALIERLAAHDGSHDRGCDGRNYACTCGDDDKGEALLKEAADALRDLTEWRDISEHDNSAKEVLVETDKGIVMVAWRHHPSSRTDIWLSVPGRYQVTPVRFNPHPVRPFPSAPNLKETGE